MSTVALLIGLTVAVLWPTVPRPLTGTVTRRHTSRGTSRRTHRTRRAGGEHTDLPHLVGLVALGVRAGAPVAHAVTVACAALPCPGADALRGAADAVARGADPETTWAALTEIDGLAAVGRALARSARTGASVVRTLDVLADDLADEQRSAHEDRARSVGVKAAIPLGVCLLPAFVLLGIVPLVAGMAATLLP